MLKKYIFLFLSRDLDACVFLIRKGNAYIVEQHHAKVCAQIVSVAFMYIIRMKLNNKEKQSYIKHPFTQLPVKTGALRIIFFFRT